MQRCGLFMNLWIMSFPDGHLTVEFHRLAGHMEAEAVGIVGRIVLKLACGLVGSPEMHREEIFYSDVLEEKARASA